LHAPAWYLRLQSCRLPALATLTDERMPLPVQPATVKELGRPGQVFYGALSLIAAALAPLASCLNLWLREAVSTPGTVRRDRKASIKPVLAVWEKSARLVRERLLTLDEMSMPCRGVAANC